MRFGLVLGVNVATAAKAGMARNMRERREGDVLRIAWRVAASWLAAILVLYLAFALAGPQAQGMIRLYLVPSIVAPTIRPEVPNTVAITGEVVESVSAENRSPSFSTAYFTSAPATQPGE